LKNYQLGVEITDLNLLDVHPPQSVVPAYRDVADALEERAQRVNEAEAYYASKVYSAAGEQAIEVLNRSAAKDKQGAARGIVSDWKLTDEMWKQLSKADAGREPTLSGEAAARLALADREAVQKVQAAHGAANRFERLLAVYRANPLLTTAQFYWKTIKETLSTRPLTIIDPAAAGRQHLLLANPNEFGGTPLLNTITPQMPSETRFPDPHAPAGAEEPEP
jgi:regulator of protease activity HflC (stomatin/prohibitin superfamily)